ncbi:CGI-121-domain-containing protein [Basidiobolus meristosporus CBS 931.73]|uniref:EKC/KEOPS complex subunit CGI121 n=1 Tax=Basidiobolus meristosporus CBS 931.73 TaxID=1314790 RepID=A0A1Y1Z079_9FUNG|nr:CGI-121-domain-containing protein [Basidiobolus meristosporus CBS 931.73]|eukprot:ORY03347.1 CGI-121-domain-containing protein [Basidiobolus meristosporus CBS 931.73]
MSVLTKEALYTQHGPVNMVLFENVTNASEIKSLVSEGDFQLGCCFVDARMILSTFQILVAANRALYMDSLGKLKTRNLLLETIFSLSPNMNIAQTLERFGVKEDSTTLVGIKIGNATEAELLQEFQSVVKGDVGKLEDIGKVADMELLQKMYKFNPTQSSFDDIHNFVISSMALKGL